MGQERWNDLRDNGLVDFHDMKRGWRSWALGSYAARETKVRISMHAFKVIRNLNALLGGRVISSKNFPGGRWCVGLVLVFF